MPYTLAQAAKAVNRTKPCLFAAIQKGRISASKNALGQWEIEPAELFRVYKPVNDVDDDLVPVVAEKEAQLRELKAKLDAMRELNEELRGQRDRWMREAEDWKNQAKALPAGGTSHPPREAPTIPLQASGSESVNITPPEAKKRPWWLFWGNDEHGK